MEGSEELHRCLLEVVDQRLCVHPSASEEMVLDSQDLRIDQLVLIVDELKTRDQWQVGRILEVEGDDGHVRQARVKLPNG